MNEEDMVELLIQKLNLLNGMQQLIANVIIGGIVDYLGRDPKAGHDYLQSNLFKKHCKLIGTNAWTIKELFGIDT